MIESLKNLNKEEVFSFRDLIDYRTGEVNSKTFIQNDKVGLTLFAFSKGEEISAHKSGGDAIITVLDGIADIEIDGKHYDVKCGESIVMPKGIPHALYAAENFKALLVVLF